MWPYRKIKGLVGLRVEPRKTVLQGREPRLFIAGRALPDGTSETLFHRPASNKKTRHSIPPDGS